jgi:hypothetical protein
MSTPRVVVPDDGRALGRSLTAGQLVALRVARFLKGELWQAMRPEDAALRAVLEKRLAAEAKRAGVAVVDVGEVRT